MTTLAASVGRRGGEAEGRGGILRFLALTAFGTASGALATGSFVWLSLDFQGFITGDTWIPVSIAAAGVIGAAAAGWRARGMYEDIKEQRRRTRAELEKRIAETERRQRDELSRLEQNITSELTTVRTLLERTGGEP